ncbi:hypothetical protein BDV33DRAFT_186757 [Aspergillus novoparasiticus]|uniref:Uncharacterized protein n=1 Tax=Aspergillus novoparasiticus TaxID=986946 RepID=A0A5N6FA20_9EURO|nr:hypothetical protein BDV33DRAFT_186757 [Aspergillus novoparasiticus]
MTPALLVLFGFLFLAFANQPSPCVKVHMVIARQSTSWPGEGHYSALLINRRQGAHIIGDILCGSIVERDFPAIPPIDDHLGERIVAAVSMGDPTFIPGLPYDFGTSKNTGVRLSSLS